ncbi:MAG: extracellular solute-binding protein, partial [Clostridia bacterium]|nr:extracellular solute-binding protein [Clostridia bacterium]
EKSKPQADVFWNGEFVQTLVLKEKGLLEKYKPSGASGVPAEFVDSEGFWSGFGGRARVLLVNKNLMKPEEYPQSIMDLLDSKYKGETIGMAYPVFGTTATHAAALYAVWGKDKARDFFKKLKEKNIQIVDGNSVVRDQVAEGRLSMGMTDTDDALEAVKKGKPVEIVFLDQKQDGMGTLVIPNTVALIKNGPNQKAGKKLVDFLMSAEAEAMLLEKGWIDLPAHRENQKLARNAGVKNLKTSFQEVFSELEASKSDMQALFVR